MKKLLGIISALAVALTFTACGGSTDDQGTTEGNATTEANATYESIYNEYSQKIIDTTSGIVTEYDAVAAETNGDTASLVAASVEKIQEIADINGEGVEKMAALLYEDPESQEEAYSEWVDKLTSVYTEQSKIIEDTYR